MLLFFLPVTSFRHISRKVTVYSTRFLLNSWQFNSSINHKLFVSTEIIKLITITEKTNNT